MSNLCKVMQRMVLFKLNHVLESKGYSSPFQSGFRKGRNTTDAVLCLESDIRNYGFVVSFLTDLFKSGWDHRIPKHIIWIMVFLKAVCAVPSYLMRWSMTLFPSLVRELKSVWGTVEERCHITANRRLHFPERTTDYKHGRRRPQLPNSRTNTFPVAWILIRDTCCRLYLHPDHFLSLFKSFTLPSGYYNLH